MTRPVHNGSAFSPQYLANYSRACDLKVLELVGWRRLTDALVAVGLPVHGPTQARRNQLLALSSVGRAVLASEGRQP
jgi:hypothetical protein